MRLSVIGCGYVGLVTGACLAEAGHEVVCTDIDRERIAKLNAGGVPIYEHHLEQILASARKAGKISYTADAGEAIRAGDTIFICVGTPPKDSGEADLSAIDHVARQIAAEAKSPKLIVEKSTVPARTGLELSRALSAYSKNSNVK
ncbi:MAG: UDP-glucose 6-dehydrogenase, partial [Acidobacteria bacterium]